MLPEVRMLLRLQEFDQQLAKLEAELALLPKHLDHLQKEVAAQANLTESLESSRKANQTERRRLENDVELHRSKIKRLKKQLLGVQQVTEYKALEHEIEWAETEITKAEERELELLMEEEQFDTDISNGRARLESMRQSFEVERQAALEKHRQGKQTVAELQTRRAAEASALAPPLASLYDRLRKKHKNGQVLAEARDARCTACHMEIRLQIWQALKNTQTETGVKPIQCESCGRVLYVEEAQAFIPH